MNYPTLFSAVLIGIAAMGCEMVEEQIASYTSCERFGGDYDAKVAEEGKLVEEVPTDDQYPMSIVISQKALNSLFEAVSEGDLGEITYTEDIFGVPITVGLDPEIPLLQIGGELGCGDCILLDMGFDVWVEIFGLRYGGGGSGRYQFPLLIEDNGMESSTVYARLNESTVLEVDVSVPGIPDAYVDEVEPWIAELATIVIQELYGNVKLFDLDAWKLGNGDIRLLGRGPHIYPDSGTVVIGLHTNLFRPVGGAIRIEPSLPENIDLGMQFHPELIQQIVERMLFEGYIPRTYDTFGEVDEGGSMKATLNYVDATDEGHLETSFRLWQTDADYCGFVDLAVGLALSVSDRQIRLDPSGIRITDSDGIGQILAALETWLQSTLTLDMAEFSELTINYREMNLPLDKKAEMSTENWRLDIGANGLSVFLNLDAVVDADSE